MPTTLLTLLAAKAKATALVAATVGVTAAVGGGTVALQTVSDTSDIDAGVISPEPEVSPEADPVKVEPVESPADGETGQKKDPVEDPENERAVAPVAPVVAFSCDPSKNHGQNVSAYARSLPKGAGRGALVSEVAKSDCGKTTAVESDEAPDTEAPDAGDAQGEVKPQKDPKGKAVGKGKKS